MRSDISTSTGAVSCDDLIEVLAAVDDSPERLDPVSEPARVHVAQCLRCQAEVANYRRLRRTLRELGPDHVASTGVAVDHALQHEILLALDEFDGRGGRRVPGYAAATIGGLAAAAGVIALATRQRRSGRLVG